MLKELLANSYLFGGNAPFIEDLYEKYLANPQSVPEEWREYFDRMQVLPGSGVKDVARAPVEQWVGDLPGLASVNALDHPTRITAFHRTHVLGSARR